MHSEGKDMLRQPLLGHSGVLGQIWKTVPLLCHRGRAPTADAAGSGFPRGLPEALKQQLQSPL
jgi:hypothetical protein